MIKNIRNLKKIDDILNSEGTILGLHQHRDQLYLSSYLKDESGTVYYSVDALILVRYFKSELKLREVFLASEDVVVPRKSSQATNYLVKAGLTELISCGDRLFSENSEGIKSHRIANLFKM